MVRGPTKRAPVRANKQMSESVEKGKSVFSVKVRLTLETDLVLITATPLNKTTQRPTAKKILECSWKSNIPLGIDGKLQNKQSTTSRPSLKMDSECFLISPIS